jgi:D-alanyl-D-alanine carboxypeptidase
LDALGRDQFAQAEAARAWTAMREAASNDGIELQIVSVFRSVDYQAALIRRKLEQGQSIDDILRVSAAPGFSEHHTGRAFDISTPGDKVLEESFEATPAYAWLSAQAARFGFTLSYPRNNAQGFNHEPWHWLYQP